MALEDKLLKERRENINSKKAFLMEIEGKGCVVSE
jgi:hypothetical protein